MSIILENLTKKYDRHPVVNNVSIEIKQGDFFVLLGSSGSGKTTVLNMIAGLTMMSEGRIILNGRDVSRLAPQERRLGYVFQQYALFQHMSVNDNVDFGPSIYKIPKAERRKRREQLLEMVGLTGLGNRYPHQLSGGQQQRVALARALAHEPEALLLDEPLGALDARIRVELRRTLRGIQRELGITTILVTHDQEEAFDLADCIGVMNYGRLVETGTPQELYQHPKSEYTASFLGTANLLVTNSGQGTVQIGPASIPLPQGRAETTPASRVQVLFRPEDVILSASPEGMECPILGMAEVEETAFIGPVERLRLRMSPIPDVRPIAPAVTFGTNSILVEASRPPDSTGRLPLQPGDRVYLGVRRIHALANPGLHCLIVTDGSLRSQAAFTISGEIARSTHARVMLLGCGPDNEVFRQHLQEARRRLGNGLASIDVSVSDERPDQAVLKIVEQQPYDLVILGFDGLELTHLVEQILQAGDHNLLLVPQPKTSLTNALICITNRQLRKNGINFPGRLAYHLGIRPTLITVLPPESENDPYAHQQAEHLLASGQSSLALFGVNADTKIRTGVVHKEILQEIDSGAYDLLVVGAPDFSRSKEKSRRGVVSRILSQAVACPILLVQASSDEKLNSRRFEEPVFA